jgi:hypothetical protein
MPDPTKHGIECTEFEALLTEAIEGQLSGARKESFDAHRRVCTVCGPLFADAQAGLKWMQSLEEVEPPAHLVHNILAATCGVASTRMPALSPQAGATRFTGRVRAWWDSYFTPVAAFVRQPRFVMSFGMIFFSFSVILNTAGVKAADVAKIDLKPSALHHTYIDVHNRVVKYYDNIRFVYEIESKVREFKRANQPAEPAAQPQKENQKNDNTSGQPDQRQDRNYSQEQSQVVVASFDVPSETVPLRLAASRELRARSEQVAQSSKLIARSCLMLQTPGTQSPVVARTMNRRFV